MALFHPIELLYEWATRRNWTPRSPLNPSPFFELWSQAPRGQALARLPDVARPPARLIVVMTYDRPEACERVLRALAQASCAVGQRERTALLVLHDACSKDYSRARSAAREVAGTCLWLDARHWLGKRNFWRSYQTAFLVARHWQPERCLFLHDDVEFEPDLLARADDIWSGTGDDPLRRVLYLFSSAKDEAMGRWIEFARRDLPERRARLTNWFDLQAFILDKACLELLNYRVIPIHPNRWRRKPSCSSGVGRQLTLRLLGRAHTYQAWPPLVSHGSEPSVANQEARGLNDLDNRLEYALAVAARASREGTSS
jgi:hypothetical protein